MDSLANVTKAAEQRRKAELELAAAVTAAREAGESLRAIAAAAGVSHEQVRRLAPQPEGERARLETRLAELDARWARLVAKIDAGYANTKADRIEQAMRNGKARKRRNRGLPALPTVAEDRRRFAERLLLDFLEGRPDDPLVIRAKLELDEAYLIRQRLAALDEARAGL